MKIGLESGISGMKRLRILGDCDNSTFESGKGWEFEKVLKKGIESGISITTENRYKNR